MEAACFARNADKKIRRPSAARSIGVIEMYKNYVKVAAHDVIGRLQEQAGKLARSRQQQVRLDSGRIAVKDQINVGDARKVIEKFFRERSKTALPPTTATRPRSGLSCSPEEAGRAIGPCVR
jgi:hypothetical protein